MKSILLHIYEDAELESRLQAAFDLARAFEGHVTCLHATPFEDYLAVDPLVSASIGEEFSEKMRKRRLALRERIEERLRIEGLEWDWIHEDQPIAEALVRRSIFADVIVLSRAITSEYRDEPRGVVGAVAVEARAPVLAVPPGLERFDPEAPAVIAWNGSPEAMMAARRALPLLGLAASVHLVVIEEKMQLYPRDSAARYLSRHGINAEIVERPLVGTVGASLLAVASEFSAGLVVMGAYGHSRLRELVFGGATREMLEESPVPLLLDH